MKLTALLAAAALFVATSAPAAIIVANLPEFSGGGSIGAQAAGTFTYVIPVGDVITGVVFVGGFGNTAASSTAPEILTLDGVTVATCGTSEGCTESPVPIVYFFDTTLFGLFTDGSAALVATQTDCCAVRLKASTLTITTITSGVPEPVSWALLVTGFAISGAALRRRRAGIAAA